MWWEVCTNTNTQVHTITHKYTQIHTHTHTHSLQCLFVTLNDEDVQIRSIAVQLTGRLSSTNPAHIMPALRKHLMQLLSGGDVCVCVGGWVGGCVGGRRWGVVIM